MIVFTLCILKSTNVNKKQQLQILSHFVRSHVLLPFPKILVGLLRRIWAGLVRAQQKSVCGLTGYKNWEARRLDPAQSLTVPNSGRPRAPACAPRAPPPVLGSQWACGGATRAGRGYKRRKPRAQTPRCGRTLGRSDRRGPESGPFGSGTSRARSDAAGAVSARWEPRRRGSALHRVSGACAASLPPSLFPASIV